ncbi:MAG: response regulator [Anaerolineae bacterium]
MDGQKLLMIVEDVPGIRELLELTLRFKSYDVVSAQNGQEALEIVQERHPALIVTDILMPRMDGFSLIYHLRKDQKTRDIPVVFLSATYVSPEDKDFATTLGATRFIEKPIELESFLATIADLLAQPPVVPPPPLKEDEFLGKYRVRLEAKLEQKNAQIERAKRLLQTSTPSERMGFEASLRQALNERQSIEVELENLHQIMEGRNPSQ